MEVDDQGEAATELIRGILEKCGCSSFVNFFKGISDEKIWKYTHDDLIIVLPKTKEGRIAAAEIHCALERMKILENVEAEIDAGVGVTGGVPMDQDEHQRGSTSSWLGRQDDDVSIVADYRVTKPIVRLTLGDDDGSPGGGRDSGDFTQGSGGSSDDESTDDDYSESDVADLGSVKKRIEELISNPPVGRRCVTETYRIIMGQPKEVKIHKCKNREAYRKCNWIKFVAARAPAVVALDVYEWCWKLSSGCPYNLFHALKSFRNLKQLCIFNGTGEKSINGSAKLDPGSLAQLEKLVVVNSGVMGYKDQLRSILMATRNLKDFELVFEYHTDANDVLDMLMKCDTSHLRRLKISTFASGYLKKDQIERLTQLQLPRLKVLQLGFGLYQDISGTMMEALLQKNMKLEQFMVPGNFRGHGTATSLPQISIEFPRLRKLVVLEMGDLHTYASHDESAVKSTGAHPVQRSCGRVTPNGLRNITVTLKFDKIYDQLLSVNIGLLFKIEKLHLACFPSVINFMVASQWHLAIVFPTKRESRNYAYPKISLIRLPDGLCDPSFVQQVPERFPNLRSCIIYFPTLTVLRTLFHCMRDTKLKWLRLETQFFFESTMEMCLSNRPKVPDEDSRDRKILKELKTYEHWKDFVKYHRIDLPSENQVEIDTAFEGRTNSEISALRGLDRLYWNHIPKVLRIPQGKQDWRSEGAEFSQTLLGYTRYPVDVESIRRALNPAATLHCLNFDVPDEFKWKTKRLDGHEHNHSSRTNPKLCQQPSADACEILSQALHASKDDED